MATIANTKSAKAIIASILEPLGLSALAGWVWDQYLHSGASDPSAALALIGPDLYERPEFKIRFPAYEALAKSGHAMSPADMVQYEKTVSQVMRAAGLPEGFYNSPDDFAKLMIANLSPDEVQQRVMQGYAAVANAAPEVRSAFKDFFGPEGDNALAAYFIDPQVALPVLEQQMTAATVAGIGRRFDIGTTKDLSLQLAQNGVTGDQAEQAFAGLSKSSGLFDENVGETQDLQVEKEGVQAAFSLTPDAIKTVERRSQSRQAAFAGSGGAASTQKGAVGLGAAGNP